MLNINPEDAAKSSAKPKSWNSTSFDDRLGFAKRDEQTTLAQSTPMVVPRLGANYSKFMSEREPAWTPTATHVYASSWYGRESDVAATAQIYAMPGILTYDFEPLFAQPSAAHGEQEPEVPNIFVQVWTRLRRLNNMTEKFESYDIQWITAGLMEIMTHVANLRRILNVARSMCSQSVKSDYFRCRSLMGALGFKLTDWECKTNWESWWRFYNVNILGVLRGIPWFHGLVPGMNRWAGLCKEIYKDDPNRTEYTQMYLFKPRHLWFLSEGELPDQTFGYMMDPEEYQQTDTSEPDAAIAFRKYMERVADLINSVFWSDSSQTILATINAVDARNWKSDLGLDFDYINIPDIPFEGEEVSLTYDFDVMLSIHNATIFDDRADGFYVAPPKLNASSRTLYQDVYLYRNTTKDEQKTTDKKQNEITAETGLRSNIARGYNVAISTCAKPINLPWFRATTDDIINATQWTIHSLSRNLSDVELKLAPGAAATDILVREQAFVNRFTATAGTWDYSSVKLWLSDWHFQVGQLDPAASRVFNSFALYPHVFIADAVASPTAVTGSYRIKGLLDCQDVLYCATSAVLNPIHEQFIRNFWGYPFELSGKLGERLSLSDKDGND